MFFENKLEKKSSNDGKLNYVKHVGQYRNVMA